MRIIIDGKTAYEGDSIPVPRVGDSVALDNENTAEVAAVTWDLHDPQDISVSIVLRHAVGIG